MRCPSRSWRYSGHEPHSQAPVREPATSTRCLEIFLGNVTCLHQMGNSQAQLELHPQAPVRESAPCNAGVIVCSMSAQDAFVFQATSHAK